MKKITLIMLAARQLFHPDYSVVDTEAGLQVSIPIRTVDGEEVVEQCTADVACRVFSRLLDDINLTAGYLTYSVKQDAQCICWDIECCTQEFSGLLDRGGIKKWIRDIVREDIRESNKILDDLLKRAVQERRRQDKLSALYSAHETEVNFVPTDFGGSM